MLRESSLPGTNTYKKKKEENQQNQSFSETTPTILRRWEVWVGEATKIRTAAAARARISIRSFCYRVSKHQKKGQMKVFAMGCQTVITHGGHTSC